MRWLDKVLRRVNEDRQILNSLWQRKHRWIDLVLRHGGLTHGITEGRMKGKFKKRKNSNITWFDKWWWLCCTPTGSWGQRGMEIQRKDVKNLLYSRSLLTLTPSATHCNISICRFIPMLNGSDTPMCKMHYFRWTVSNLGQIWWFYRLLWLTEHVFLLGRI